MTHKIPDKFRQPTISTKEYVLLAVDVLKKQLVSLLLPSKMPYEVRQTEILQDLYITGQMIGCLPMTFESFCIAVNKKIDPYYRHWPRWGGWDRTGGTYRNGPKYRKNTDHLPKEKIEDEWDKEQALRDVAEALAQSGDQEGALNVVSQALAAAGDHREDWRTLAERHRKALWLLTSNRPSPGEGAAVPKE